MSSNILTIYDELAASTVVVGGTTLQVKDADELPNRVNDADLPVRLLTPLSELGADGGSSDTVWLAQLGSGIRQIRWIIHDIMLWQPIALDVGVKAWAKELLAYQAQYYVMLETLSLSGVVGLNVSTSAQVIEYPAMSGNFYAGVRATLTIDEKYG